MNGVVTEKNVIKGLDGGTIEDLFLDIVKLCTKSNKSKDYEDLIHGGQVGLGISDFGQDI